MPKTPPRTPPRTPHAFLRALTDALRRRGKRPRKPAHRGANQGTPPIGVLAAGAQWHLVGRQSLNRTNGRIETQLVLARK